MATDFRNKTFQKILRGYAPEEVDAYLAYITEAYQKLERRAGDSERKLALALKKLDEARIASDAAEESNAAAAQAAEAILAQAEAAAEVRLAEAHAEAERIVADAAQTAMRIRTEAAGVYEAAEEMYDEVSAFRETLFKLYSGHIESVEDIAQSAKGYIERVQKLYTGATGEELPAPDADEDDERFEDECCATDEALEPVEDDAVAGDDLYIDIPDEDDTDDVRIDWANRRAVLADDAPADDDFAEDFADDEDGAETRVLDLHGEQIGDILDEEDDVDPLAADFATLDALFSEDFNEKGKDDVLSLTDEFDLVFSSKNTSRNIEEIRRQPTIPAAEPKKPKKHR